MKTEDKKAQASEYESQYGSELTPDQAKSIDKDILDFYYERNEEIDSLR